MNLHMSHVPWNRLTIVQESGARTFRALLFRHAESTQVGESKGLILVSRYIFLRYCMCKSKVSRSLDGAMEYVWMNGLRAVVIRSTFNSFDNASLLQLLLVSSHRQNYSMYPSAAASIVAEVGIYMVN